MRRTSVDHFYVAVTGPWRYCPAAVASLLWSTIAEFVGAATADRNPARWVGRRPTVPPPI